MKTAAYWQRWGLEAGADFEGFLQRQEKHALQLERKLERERQLVPAGAAAASVLLSPGSQRILEYRRRQVLVSELAAVVEERGDSPADGGSSQGVRRGLAGRLVMAVGLGGTGTGALPVKPGGTGAVPEAGPPAAFSYCPAITARAAARPGRTPEELHADWAAQQARLAARRQEAEAAALAQCTFQPDVAPAAGRGSKYAAAKGHINMQARGAGYWSW